MSPVLAGVLIWIGVMAVLVVLAWVRHRFERRHARALEYQRQAVATYPIDENGTSYHYPLSLLEHDYEASLEASRQRRGKN